jgi:hypothetical protein
MKAHPQMEEPDAILDSIPGGLSIQIPFFLAGCHSAGMDLCQILDQTLGELIIKCSAQWSRSSRSLTTTERHTAGYLLSAGLAGWPSVQRPTPMRRRHLYSISATRHLSSNRVGTCGMRTHATAASRMRPHPANLPIAPRGVR